MYKVSSVALHNANLFVIELNICKSYSMTVLDTNASSLPTGPGQPRQPEVLVSL